MTHDVAGTSVQSLIAQLIEALPNNGHVMTTSRWELTLAPATLLASGRVATVVQRDLEFTDSELEQLSYLNDPSDGGDGTITELSQMAMRWPVQLALSRRGGEAEQVRYLSEEILAPMDPDRKQCLAAIAVLGICDSDLFAALAPDADEALETVVGGLPLVHRYASGVVRLHDLWIRALDGILNAEEIAGIHRRAASIFMARSEFTKAFASSLDANDRSAARRAAVEQASFPLLGQNIHNLRRCRELLTGAEFALLPQVFSALEAGCSNGMHSATEDFEEALRAAQELGDTEVESLLVYRLVQSSIDHRIGLTPNLASAVDRLRGHDSANARVAVAHADIIHATSRGAMHEVRPIVDELMAIEGPVAAQIVALVLIDLARPEEVVAEDRFVPEGTEGLWGYALVMRGGLSPDEIMATIDYVQGEASRAPVDSRITTIAATAVMAVCAGDNQRAQGCVDELVSIDQRLIGSNISSQSHLARASLALGERDEEAAAAAIASALEVAPLGNWLYRSYFLVLSALYLLAPDERDRIERYELGPVLTEVVLWSKALVELRETKRPGAVAGVDFSELNLLRTHFSPPLLTEMAVAGTLDGSTDAAKLLADLPNLSRNLRATADRYSGPMRQQANALLRQYPSKPLGERRLTLFGGIGLQIGGSVVENPDWRRARVQELLAWLVLNRSGRRAAIAEALWPEIGDVAAQNNLRVQLSHLHRVLEPDRVTAMPPWFVRSDGEFIALESEGLSSDVADFDQACTQASDADRQGVPTLALKAYQEAVGYYGGDLLGSLPDADWVLFDRLERRSQATTALVRIGELSAARGEPETASEMATNALRIDPLSQRAARMFINALRAKDDTSGAREAARELHELLASNVEAIEPDTRRLMTQLDLPIDDDRNL